MTQTVAFTVMIMGNPATAPPRGTRPPYRAMRDHYQQQEQGLARAMADRQEWEQATAGSRRLASAADTELRRRHPERKIEPLRSAEPATTSDTGRGLFHPVADGKLIETAALIRDLAMQHEEFRAEMDERRLLIVPGQDHGNAFGAMKTPGQDAILQPPNRRSPPRPGSSGSSPSMTSNPRLEANHC